MHGGQNGLGKKQARKVGKKGVGTTRKGGERGSREVAGIYI